MTANAHVFPRRKTTEAIDGHARVKDDDGRGREVRARAVDRIGVWSGNIGGGGMGEHKVGLGVVRRGGVAMNRPRTKVA